MEALAATVFNGALVCQRSKFKSWLRNFVIGSLALVPSLKHTFEMGPRGIMMRYKYFSFEKGTDLDIFPIHVS
jgi:hypothetical protein